MVSLSPPVRRPNGTAPYRIAISCPSPHGSYREGTYGPLHIVQEGRLGYQEYAYRAFETLGVPRLQDPPVAFTKIYGLDIPHDSRDPLKLGAHTYVVSESYIMQAVEQGLTPKLADWARRVYEVQKRRSH